MRGGRGNSRERLPHPTPLFHAKHQSIKEASAGQRGRVRMADID